MKHILLVLSILFASSSMVLASSSYDQADVSYCANKWGASSGSYKSCIGGRADKTGTHHHSTSSYSSSYGSSSSSSSGTPWFSIILCFTLGGIALNSLGKAAEQNMWAKLNKKAEEEEAKKKAMESVVKTKISREYSVVGNNITQSADYEIYGNKRINNCFNKVGYY